MSYFFEEEKQANVIQMDEALVWHRCFAHCLGEKLRVLKEIYHELPRDLPLTFGCKDCSRANMKQKEFKSMKGSYTTVDTCSADLCGPLQVLSMGGARYFLIMVDMGSRFTHIGFLRNKEAKEIVKKLLFWMDCLHRHRKKYFCNLRTDNSTEFNNYQLQI
jgi:hypothetical protein